MALPGGNFPPVRPGIYGGGAVGFTLAVEYGLLGGVFTDPIATGGRHPAGSPGGIGGQFKTTFGELDALNRGFEERLRNRWADIAAEKRTDRPRTGRLEAAIRDPRNGTIGKGPALIGPLPEGVTSRGRGGQVGASFGFGVGMPGFLDSQAKYWRIIEQGSAVAAPNWIGEMRDRSGIPLYVTNGRFGKRGGELKFLDYGGQWSPGPAAYTSGTTEGKLQPASQGLRRLLYERGWQIPYRNKPIPPLNAHLKAWDEVMGPGGVKYFSQLQDVVLPALGVTPSRARQITSQLQRKRV